MSIDQKKLRLGLIGAGFVAQVAHLHAFERVDEVEIAAIAEPHDALRELVAARHKVPVSVPDYRDLLDMPDIDAVVVCMPRRAQSLIVAEAIEAKRGVLSEKPMAMTLAEAETMVAAARRRGTIWAVGYMKRHDVGVQRFAAWLRAAVADGDWGEILDVEMRDFCLTYGVTVPPHERRHGARPIRYKEGPVGPGFVSAEQLRDYEYCVNVASHDINLLRLLFGDTLKPVSLIVHAGRAQRVVLDAGKFAVTLAFGPGDVGCWDQVLTISFAKGRATLRLPSPLARQESASIELIHDNSSEQIRVPSVEHVWAFEAQARSFARSVRDGVEPPNSGQAVVADLALIENLWRMVDWRQ